MSMTSPAPGTRWFATGRMAWGAFLLNRPGRMFDIASHTVGDRAAHRVTVALGVRETVQAGLGLIFTGPVALRAGAAVDATHALSMLAVAARSQRYRRPALVSAGVACAAALIGLALTERNSEGPILAHTRGLFPLVGRRHRVLAPARVQRKETRPSARPPTPRGLPSPDIHV